MAINFNISDIKNMLTNFYTLTKIRIVIFDDSFHEIASYPTRHSRYCILIRDNPQAYSKCIECDHNACLYSKKTQQIHTYRCHAGLTETVVPIKADNMIIGYIMFGQLLQTDQRNLLWQKIVENLSEYNINLKDLYTAFNKKQNLGKEYINAAAQMIEMSAAYLHLSRKITLHRDSLAQKIDKYIIEHITEDLTAPVIFNKFNISKSHLYTLSNDSFGMGIAQYIRSIRIHNSKRLLGDTNMSINQIAVEVGIYDYNYFTKVFKRETGILPTDFRRDNTLHAINFIQN